MSDLFGESCPMCTNEEFGASEFPGQGNPHCPQCRGSGMLLPAIEPAKEGFSGPTVAALTAYLDFWMAFRGDVQEGLIDPCGGGYFLLSDGARLKCDYPTREAALSEAAAVIAAVDQLLGGAA